MEMVGGVETGLGLGLAAVGEGSLDTSYGDLHNRAHTVTGTHRPAFLSTCLSATANLSFSVLTQRLQKTSSKSKGTCARSIKVLFDRHQ